MLRSIPPIALCLVATLIPSIAAGFRAGPIPGDPVTAAAEPRWFKGNLHTHSLWSDGDDYPEMIADWYARHGYHFLALSDHNVLARGRMAQRRPSRTPDQSGRL